MSWPRRVHGPLQQLSPNVWRVEGPTPGTIAVLRQMTIVRDPSGRLLLHSAIALDPPRMRELLALGTPTWLVVPNEFHRLDAPAYKARFPNLVVVAPRGAIARVSHKVRVDETYENFRASEVIRLHAAPWPNGREGVLEIRDASQTILVFNDLLFHPPRGGPASWPYRWIGSCGLQVPWLSRKLLVPDVLHLRAWLFELAELEHLAAVVPGHGDPVLSGAADALRAAARALSSKT